jgi:hypothetical protein
MQPGYMSCVMPCHIQLYVTVAFNRKVKLVIPDLDDRVMTWPWPMFHSALFGPITNIFR